MPSSYWKNILPHLFTYFPLILICKPGLDLFNCPNRTSWRGGGAGGSNVRRPAPAVPLMLPFLIKICKTGMNLFNCPNCTSWWRQRVQPMQSEAGDGGGADGGNGRLPAVEVQEAAGAGSAFDASIFDKEDVHVVVVVLLDFVARVVNFQKANKV